MSPNEGRTLRGIRQIRIPVGDLERATEFYRDRLGLRYLFTAPPGMAFFDCGGIRLMLGGPEGPQRAAAPYLLYYSVDDIHAAAADLRARGVRLRSEPHLVHRGGGVEVWLAEFEDSEANLAALMSEVKVEGE